MGKENNHIAAHWQLEMKIARRDDADSIGRSVRVENAFFAEDLCQLVSQEAFESMPGCTRDLVTHIATHEIMVIPPALLQGLFVPTHTHPEMSPQHSTHQRRSRQLR